MRRAGALAWWALLGAAVTLLPASAAAQVPPSLTLDDDRVVAGATVTVRGAGHGCTTAIVLALDGDAVAQLPATPSFTTAVTIPDTTTPGDHILTSTCSPGQTVQARAALVVETASVRTTTTVDEATTTTATTSATTTTITTTTSSTGTTTTTTTTTVAAGAGPSDRTGFAAALPAVDELSFSWSSLFAHLGLVALLVLLIKFPAEIFNSTFTEHYDEIVAPFRTWRRPRRLPSAVGLTAFALVAAALSAIVEPGFGFNAHTLALAVGLFVAFVVVMAVFDGAFVRTVRRAAGPPLALRLYPAALVVALACAALSRSLDFRPGYVYGLVAGFAVVAGRRLRPDHEGRAIAMGAVAVLATSVAVWLAWLPVDRYADDEAIALPFAVLDAAMSAVFVAGVEGMVFQLLPLRFLDGAALRAWSRAAWMALFGAATLAFVYVIMATDVRVSSVDRGHPPPVIPMLVLFVAFGAFSVTFWAYFRFRSR